MPDDLTTAERLIETTIGLWPDDDPPGQRPPRLAAAIVKALREEGYMILLRNCSCSCIVCTVLPEEGFTPEFVDD